MIVSTKTQECVLEIHGPKNRHWRPVAGANAVVLKEVLELIDRHDVPLLINMAKATWKEKHPEHSDVSFRVKFIDITYSGLSVDDVTDAWYKTPQ